MHNKRRQKRVVKRLFSGINVALYFSFWVIRPQTPTGTPPLDPAGGLPSPDSLTQLDTPNYQILENTMGSVPHMRNILPQALGKLIHGETDAEIVFKSETI